MDTGGEIKLGSMLFTLVEPHRGHEVAYNRWYERDHFYAGCMIGPWLFAGKRWVATRAMKDLRKGSQPDVFGGADLGSYLAIYWVVDGKQDEHFGWGLRQVRWLHENGRMFPERDHIHTLLYNQATSFGPPDGVPAELALDHPYAGLVATFFEGDPDDVPVTPGTLAVRFRPIELNADAPVAQAGQENLANRSMLLTFLDHEPRAADVHDGPGVLWSAPFLPTIPGTDTYTDELW